MQGNAGGECFAPHLFRHVFDSFQSSKNIPGTSQGTPGVVRMSSLDDPGMILERSGKVPKNTHTHTRQQQQQQKNAISTLLTPFFFFEKALEYNPSGPRRETGQSS